MRVTQAVDEYRYGVLSLSPRTQEWYLGKLQVFVDWSEAQSLNLEDITATVFRKFVDSLRSRPHPRTGKSLSTYTIHGYAQVVKGFLNWCESEELLKAAPKIRRKDMPRVEQKVIEVFTDEQICAMLAACDKAEYWGMPERDRAIVWLLLDTGIRASELCNLRVGDVSLKPNDAFVRVTGKGRKCREVGLGKRALAALHRYTTRFRQVPDDVAVEGRDRVFFSRQGALTVSGLEQIIERVGDRAHVKGVRCSPHTFRHTFAVRFLEEGGDLYSLSRLMGHGSGEGAASVTQVYLRAMTKKQARKLGISVGDSLKHR